MKNIVKRVGTAVVSIFIVVLVLLSIIISISSITAKANNGVPDLFGYTPFSVQTDSMNPTISKGDYIFVEKCDAESLKVGDVITYFTIIEGARVVNTHRIVNVYNSNGMIEYQTQGDNKETNPEPDKLLVSPGDIIGKYTGTSIPLMGSVMDFLSTQMGFFFVILLPVLLFTLYQIYNLVSVVLHNHKVDMISSVNNSASDEVKEAIIAEYLAKQQNKKTDEEHQEEKQENKTEDEKTEDNEETSDNTTETSGENEETEDKND